MELGTCTLRFGENRPFGEGKNREKKKEKKHGCGQGRDLRLLLAAWPALGLKVHGPPSSGGRCDISASRATTASAAMGLSSTAPSESSVSSRLDLCHLGFNRGGEVYLGLAALVFRVMATLLT